MAELKAMIEAALPGASVEVSDEELAAVPIKGDKFHGEWNYTITPRAP